MGEWMTKQEVQLSGWRAQIVWGEVACPSFQTIPWPSSLSVFKFIPKNSFLCFIENPLIKFQIGDYPYSPEVLR